MNQQPHDLADDKRAPLAPSVLHILVALAAGPRTARDVAAEVGRISGHVISERTNRRLLGRMEALEVLRGPRGRLEAAVPEFALAPLGVAILCDEIRRLRTLIDRIDVQALCAAGSLRVGNS